MVAFSLQLLCKNIPCSVLMGWSKVTSRYYNGRSVVGVSQILGMTPLANGWRDSYVFNPMIANQ